MPRTSCPFLSSELLEEPSYANNPCSRKQERGCSIVHFSSLIFRSCKHMPEFIAARNVSAESPSPSLAGNQKPSPDSSDGDCRSGNSPGSRSSLLCAFPRFPPVTFLRTPQGTGQIRSLIQWRDRTGIPPDFLIKSSTPDPMHMKLSMLRESYCTILWPQMSSYYSDDKNERHQDRSHLFAQIGMNLHILSASMAPTPA